jgi:hypothetical protein
MIPKVINFLFGLDSSFCKKPFEYFHYLNVLSAKQTNKDYTINLYYYYKPNNIWFDKLNDVCNLIKLDTLDIFIPLNKIAYTEHLSDIIRLEILNKYGGIYIDIDTICIKSFDDLLHEDFVMGMEYGRHLHDNEHKLIGLCNAVLMSQPNSKFSNIWLNDYHINYKEDWNYNSVKRPLQLSYEYCSDIRVEPQSSFFKYSWDEYGKNAMFNENSDIGDCYSLHLWEHKNYNYLIKYNKEYIVNNNDTISKLYKKIIN